MLIIDQIQAAARMVEHEGVDCFHTIKERVGEDVALALIIAHLRREFGGGKGGYPSDTSIDAKVVEALKKERII